MGIIKKSYVNLPLDKYLPLEKHNKLKIKYACPLASSLFITLQAAPVLYVVQRQSAVVSIFTHLWNRPGLLTVVEDHSFKCLFRFQNNDFFK